MSKDEADAPANEDRPRRPSRDAHARASDRTKQGTLGARDAARKALQEFTGLAEDTVEGVVAVERDDDAWKVTLQVLEDPHIPSTSDIMAEYQVRLTADGELLGYKRGRRYVRGQVEA